ncbi:phage portal protein [Eubacteriaceae bacterium ES2]|nr:phage portal protein [Eubacteriaceae bacterium ES2]
MGLITWIRDFLSGGIVSSQPVTEEEFYNTVTETCFRELAFFSAVNFIANSISKCEFKTYKANEEVREKEYYLWNIEPNKNQNSSEFLHKLIYKLHEKNECLVIIEGDQFLVADDFNVKEFVLHDNLYSNIMVGDFSFSKTYSEKEVFHFKLHEQNMRKVINLIYASYGKLLTYGMKSYQKSRGSKGILNYDTIKKGDEEARKAFDELMNVRFKAFFENDNAVLPLPKGYSFEDIGSKTYSNEGTRDIRAMMDDISDFTARAFGIPPALMRGDIAGISDAMQSYLTFCIDPLIDMLQEEINRKRNGYVAFTKGTYLKIDTRNIKHIDILESATPIDKLIASGVYSINQMLDMLGEKRIEEEWADKHFITKNYSTVEDLLAAMGNEPPNTG